MASAVLKMQVTGWLSKAHVGVLAGSTRASKGRSRWRDGACSAVHGIAGIWCSPRQERRE